MTATLPDVVLNHLSGISHHPRSCSGRGHFSCKEVLGGRFVIFALITRTLAEYIAQSPRSAQLEERCNEPVETKGLLLCNSLGYSSSMIDQVATILSDDSSTSESLSVPKLKLQMPRLPTVTDLEPIARRLFFFLHKSVITPVHLIIHILYLIFVSSQLILEDAPLLESATVQRNSLTIKQHEQRNPGVGSRGEGIQAAGHSSQCRWNGLLLTVHLSTARNRSVWLAGRPR